MMSKMRFKKIISLIFLLFFIEILSAQELNVFDSESKEPIANIAVFCNNEGKIFISDAFGKLNLNSFCKNDSIIIQHASYTLIKLSFSDLKERQFKVFLKKKNIELEEFVVSASKYKEKKKNTAFSIQTLNPNLINETPPPTSADLLTQNGNVMIQKTQGGGGSPILRGFEANKLLMVIDGVRMNNAIYRGGHLQNSITIDNAILEKTEIIFGASSVIYGSDALGGSIHYYTKKPKLSENKELFTQLNGYSRYSSADDAFHFHVDLNLGNKKFASLSSLTYKNFNNISIGENRNSQVSNDYGLTYFYTKRENNKDSMYLNSDPNVQIGTAYKQYDFLQKILFTPTKRTEIIANIQYSTSSNINRYDKLTEMNDDKLKYAEYYYAPQNRFFASISFKSKNSNKYFTNSTIIFSLQKIDEDRASRKFNNNELNIQKEDLWAYAVNFDFFKLLNNENRFNYGAEITFNSLNSTAFYKNILTGEIHSAITRYPNGQNFTQNYSLYANYKHFINPKITANLGARYSLANLQSEFEGEFFEFLDFKAVNISAAAPTGIASLVFNPNKNWKLATIASTAYRIPNIDDYGKVRTKDSEVTIPAKDLKPEYTYNTEFSIEKRFFTKVKLNFTAYHTWLTNAIVRTYSQVNGSNFMLYDGDNYRIIVNSNAQRAVIYGFSLALHAKFNFSNEINIKQLEFFSTLTYTKGKNISENLPLGHIPPLFGISRVKYKYNKLNFAFWSNYNALKPIANFSPYGEDNEAQAPDFGYPAWFTLNTQFAYSFNERINLQLAVENILDTHYKSFASAISAPGRNIILSFKFVL